MEKKEPLLEEAKRHAWKQHTTLTEVLADDLRLLLKQSAEDTRKPMPYIYNKCLRGMVKVVLPTRKSRDSKSQG